MSDFFIRGGHSLYGKIRVSTSKNATLPILAASVLTDKEVIIRQIPSFSDIEIMLKILEDIGVKVTKKKNTVILDSSSIFSVEPNHELTKEVRASIFLLGPILAKYK